MLPSGGIYLDDLKQEEMDPELIGLYLYDNRRYFTIDCIVHPESIFAVTVFWIQSLLALLSTDGWVWIPDFVCKTSDFKIKTMGTKTSKNRSQDQYRDSTPCSSGGFPCYIWPAARGMSGSASSTIIEGPLCDGVTVLQILKPLVTLHCQCSHFQRLWTWCCKLLIGTHHMFIIYSSYVDKNSSYGWQVFACTD